MKILKYVISVCFFFSLCHILEREPLGDPLCFYGTTKFFEEINLEKLSNYCWAQNVKSMFCFIFK